MTIRMCGSSSCDSCGKSVDGVDVKNVRITVMTGTELRYFDLCLKDFVKFAERIARFKERKKL